MRRLAAISIVALLVLVASGAAADTFSVSLVSQTNSTVTLGWTPQSGYGYLFSSAGVVRSRTNDPARSTVRFAKVSPASYDVDVMAKGNSGIYQPDAPPPPPPPPPPSGCPLPAYPDASCTGVPPGTTLTPSGGLTISTAGTVINARDITGQVVVNAPNVTIRNTRIRNNSMWAVDNNSTGLLIEDSEIIGLVVAGQNKCHNAIGDANFTLRRVEISGCENGLNIGAPGNVTFEDSYMHNLDTTGPSYVFGNNHPHTDGIQTPFDGGSNIIIRHNTIDPVPAGESGTSGIIFPGDGSPVSNTWVEDNYIDGTGVAAAIYAPRIATHDVYINRNAMLKGAYGNYTFCVKVGTTVTQFNGNKDANTGAAIAPDNGSGGGCTN